MTSDASMLLVLPVPFRMLAGRLHVEAQAANGLDRWADSFTRVTVAAPLAPEWMMPNLPGFVWRDVATLQHLARVETRPLPWAYTPLPFARQLGPVRRRLAAEIARATHLQFAIGGLVGDWAALAAIEAIRQQRRYAIHTDRVEHEVMRKTAAATSGLRRARIALEAPLLERYHRHVIRHSSLGLWHGDDCFRAYSPWCRENYLVHDVHTKAADRITADQLAHKLEDILRAETLHLCYAGRLDPMKAPLEWLQAIASARSLGARLDATWYGEGALLEAAQAEAQRLNLTGVVHFPGFVDSRAELLAHVRTAHALVYTHITPESPRNLIESLVSGTPILGYDNAYALDLLAHGGGGATVPLHDTAALGTLIATLARDRPQLARMTTQAAASGSRFTDTTVFAERSELIKRFA